VSLAALQDLFARVRAGATGVWTLGVDPHRIIYLEQGRIVFAQSTHPLDRLTHLLVEKGKLTQAQMDYAMDNLAPGLSIGRNLIQMGFITQRDLLDIARFQVERVVWGALGTDGLEASFVARDLDSSVVRLALDTPSLLLGGLLNLRDRERLLELLGPLDQILALQTPPPEASLPPDLLRVPALLDGQRTLLDLARESGTEPMRLGALALFLKEMRWAGVVAPSPALPPVSAALLEGPDHLVVVAPPAPLEPPGLTETQPVPASPLPPAELPPPRRASLIEHIQAAQQPTANLDQMAEQLDRAMEPPPAGEPIAVPIRAEAWPEPPRRDDDEITAENPVPPDLPETHAEAHWRVEEGQALLPEPLEGSRNEEDAAAGAPHLEPLDPQPEPFPLPVEAPAPFVAEGAPDFRPHRRRLKKKSSVLLLSLPFVAVLGLAIWLFRVGPPPEPTPVPVPPPAEPKVPSPKPAPEGKPGPGLAVPPETGPKTASPAPAEAPPVVPAKPPAGPDAQTPPAAPAPAPAAEKPGKAEPPPASADQRWTTLRAGKVDQALAQGRAHVKTLPGARWTLRLEIACQAETLRNAAAWMESRSKDLFILPMAMRGGQTCNQLFVGSFASKAEAEAQIPKLPPQFREGGNRPRAFQVSEIPARQ
jgi:hypothetical protein